MNIVVSGGGTGGHIYPALALIREIKKENKNANFLYIGTQNFNTYISFAPDWWTYVTSQAPEPQLRRSARVVRPPLS